VTDGRVVLRPRGVQPGTVAASGLAGSAFAIAGDIALTAAHVVRGLEAVDVVFEPCHTNSVDLGLVDVAAIEVAAIDVDESLDAATLRLRRPFKTSTRIASATPGLRWTVTTRPTASDPQLTGEVEATERIITNERGHNVAVIQLLAEQDLRDFHGYSGSAVRLASAHGTIVGLLVEQVNERLRTPGLGRQAASNVLYAVAIGAIVTRFAIAVDEVPTVSPFVRVGALLDAGEALAADRALDALQPRHRDSAAFWQWRAQVALASQNPDVACVYADQALRRDARHVPGVAAKVKALLLRGRPGDRSAARELADRSRGINSQLDNWLACLDRSAYFDAGVWADSEMETLCPFPDRF
jgi:hypothetical protein